MRPHSTGNTLKNYVGGLLAVHGILVITFLLTLLLGACASVPRYAGYDGAAEVPQAALHVEGANREGNVPLCRESCWVMSVRNDNFYDAKIYINGMRAATLPGLMAKEVGIPITRSMLDAGGCINVFVRLQLDAKTAHSSKVCPGPGSRLQLSIENSSGAYPLHLWLQDWGR
jgi:hypothetical protein